MGEDPQKSGMPSRWPEVKTRTDGPIRGMCRGHSYETGRLKLNIFLSLYAMVENGKTKNYGQSGWRHSLPDFNFFVLVSAICWRLSQIAVRNRDCEKLNLEHVMRNELRIHPVMKNNIC
jgi:hypothetical protein